MPVGIQQKYRAGGARLMQEFTAVVEARVAFLADLCSTCNPAGPVERRMALTSGDRLGVYEVVALIGAGGMGEVCPERDTSDKFEAQDRTAGWIIIRSLKLRTSRTSGTL